MRNSPHKWGNPQTTGSLGPTAPPHVLVLCDQWRPRAVFAQPSGPSGAGGESVHLHLSVSARRKLEAEGTSARAGARPSSLRCAVDASSREASRDALLAAGGAPCTLGSAPTTAGCLSMRPSTCQRPLVSMRTAPLGVEEGGFRVRAVP